MPQPRLDHFSVIAGLFCLVAFPLSLTAEPVPAPSPEITVVPAAAKAPVPRLSSHPVAQEIDALWKDGKKSQAKKRLDKWMDEEKKSALPWVQSAKINFDEKNFNRAQSLSKSALAKDPQCADAYYWRGRSLEELKKPLDAANEYRAALIADPQFNEAQFALDRVSAQLDSK